MTYKTIIKPLLVTVAATTLGGGLGFPIWKEEHRQPILEIYVFALSGGRSIFLRTPTDRRLLIDGGSNGDIVRELTKILPFYSRRIDAVMATNTEGRNLGGLIEIIERYKVDQVYMSAVTLQNLGLASSTDEVANVFEKTVQREKVPVRLLQAEDTLALDQGVSFGLLFPATKDDFAYSKTSAPEILFKVAFGQTSLLFAGNATNKVQKYLVSENDVGVPDLGSNVLVVSHSALPDNLNLSFMEKVSPEYLIYSKVPRVTNTSKTDQTKKKPVKEPPDPLVNIPLSNRFNIREQGTIKITSNGFDLIVSRDGEVSPLQSPF